jgi:uncharacterized protein (DUF58 family)
VKFIRSLYFTQRLYLVLVVDILFFVLGYFFGIWFAIARGLFIILVMALLLDILLLYGPGKRFIARRILGDRLSNGDDNPILISVQNNYGYPVKAEVIDEAPEQFQLRSMRLEVPLRSGEDKVLRYTVRPTKRGEYVFGTLNVYVSGILYLARRRMKFEKDKSVAVYPSFIQMRKYELVAISNRLTEAGIKRIRKVGRTMEFDQVKDYVPGDDIRTINWKATARKAGLMVNQYEDERSQQVYSIIDKGRVMKMPFEGLTLLDYAINASLVISNIAQLKHDKPGLVTFSEKMGAFIPAERSGKQMNRIMEVLYKQKTRFLESNYEKLFIYLRYKITTRSLLLFYTNFESLVSLRRQLPFFRRLAKSHVLVVIFFENTELKTLLNSEASTLEDVYIKTIAERQAMEKRIIVKELSKYGIHAVLVPPQQLNIGVINKYLELKARALI